MTEGGFWFDDRLTLMDCVATKQTKVFLEQLYQEIFPTNKVKNINRLQRMRTLETFVCNLMLSNAKMLAPTHSNYSIQLHLDRNYWTGKTLGYRHVVEVFNYFHDNNLVKAKMGFEYLDGEGGGRVTRIMNRQHFSEQLRNIIELCDSDHYIALESKTPLVLRDTNGKIVKFGRDRRAWAVIDKLKRINKVNSSQDINYLVGDTGRRYPVDTFVYAVYNGDLNTAGRFYGGRNSHINMKEKVRRTILIDGESICELDYKSLHIMLLYAKVGQTFDGDPYTCVLKNKELRDILKKVLLSLLNDKCDEKSLVEHIEWNLLGYHNNIDKNRHVFEWDCAKVECETNQQLLDSCDVNILELVRRFKSAHSPIAKFFHTGIWGEMQNVDSKIALEVMWRFVGREIPCLPRHDSFMMQRTYCANLESVMKSAYSKITKTLFGRSAEVRVDRKI